MVPKPPPSSTLLQITSTTENMKKLFTSIALAMALVVPVLADTFVVPLTANVVSNAFASTKLITSIAILATTTNNTKVQFYDASTTDTNYIQAAYTSYVSYATNYDVIFTNSASILVTNTFRGRYTAPVVNAGSTNERPKILTVTVPASSLYNADVQLHPIRGISLLSPYAAIVTLTYENPQ